MADAIAQPRPQSHLLIKNVGSPNHIRSRITYGPESHPKLKHLCTLAGITPKKPPAPNHVKFANFFYVVENKELLGVIRGRVVLSGITPLVPENLVHCF